MMDMSEADLPPWRPTDLYHLPPDAEYLPILPSTEIQDVSCTTTTVHTNHCNTVTDD